MKEFFILVFLLFAGSIILVTCSDSGGPNDPYVGKTIAITNGYLIDGTGSGIVSNATIIVKDGRIEAVLSDSNQDIPADSKVVDVNGLYILPGFINSHVHQSFDENKLTEWAIAGVTTVRDVGNNQSPGDLFSQRNLLNADNRNARIVATGPLVTTVGGYGGYPVTSPDDAEQKINGLINDGADLIKIAIEDNLQGRTWPMLSMDEINRIVQTAHKQNKRVAAHISRSLHLNMAIKCGVDDVNHMVINYVPDSLNTFMVQQDMYWIPTLELWKGVSEMYSLNWINIAKSNLQRFVQSGGKVALGTDYAGYTTPFDSGMPITEIKLMEEAGMTPMQIIVSATKYAAYVCGLGSKLGTIEEGKIADIIVVNGNPLDDLESLLNIQMVIHNGEVVVDKINKM